jgi:hypothetical protein
VEDAKYSTAELYRDGKLIASGALAEVKPLAQPGDVLNAVRRNDGLAQDFEVVEAGQAEGGVDFVMMPL